MGDVIELGCNTTADLPAEKVLDAAKAAALTEAVVVGMKADGTIYFAMTTSSAPDVNWLLDCAKKLLMDEVVE